MNLQSKFGYCIITQTLIIALCLKAGRNYGRTDRQTDGQTDKRTDDPITRCPRRTFQAGGIKIRSTKSIGYTSMLMCTCYMFLCRGGRAGWHQCLVSLPLPLHYHSHVYIDLFMFMLICSCSCWYVHIYLCRGGRTGRHQCLVSQPLSLHCHSHVHVCHVDLLWIHIHVHICLHSCCKYRILQSQQ